MSFAQAYARERPAETAIRDASRSYTWAEVDDILNRCANALLAMNNGKATKT